MPRHPYSIEREGERRYLLVDYKKSKYGPSIADYPYAMWEVIDLLTRVSVDYIILAEFYSNVYNEKQTAMLKEISDLFSTFKKENIYSYGRLINHRECEPILKNRYNAVMSIAGDNLKADPIRAYLTLNSVIKKEKEMQLSLQGKQLDCSQHYLKTLVWMLSEFDKIKLIKDLKLFLTKSEKMPAGREIYHSMFEPQIKPSFVSSRITMDSPEEIELIDEYYILDEKKTKLAKVNIFKNPEKVQFLYHISPPEYTLSPEKYFLMMKTRDLVAEFHPEGMQFLAPEDIKKYFLNVHESTISDLARKNKISISSSGITELANIVARYTVGYGMMELLLSDRKLTDIYMDAPLGSKPIYVVHGEYGSCQTNVFFTEGEAKKIVSRFRAVSGRPFDEAHPVLDMSLEELQTRVCVIGKPLSPDGMAFALRLHKTTPWTLPQFIDVKMMDSQSAGLLSFFIDAQASTLVNGSRGAGKSSLLMSLMLEILPSLRMIVQEDTLEIPVGTMKSFGYNIQRLKTQSAIAVSRTSAEVPPEEALRTALRLGDSVLIVGEVRSKEAQVLYEAMRVGAVGNVVMGTIHGENAYSVWDRIVNDLDVPNTSFKATDIVVTCAPIRFKGSLRRNRRLIEITEVGKHWYEDPEREKGFIDLLEFDAKKDNHRIMEENMGKSELFPKIARQRGLSLEDLWEDIQARSVTKQFLVDMKNKHNIPNLLEGSYTVPANDKWLLTLQNQREELGGVNYKNAITEWKKWVTDSQVKPLIKEST